ncbi:MAG: hypothetical protein ABIO55_00835 [Ginsengibacter sp.]
MNDILTHSIVLLLQTDTASYSSPIGNIFIRGSDNTIEEVLFVNSLKKVTIGEEEIDFKAGRSLPIQRCIDELKEYFAGTRKHFTLPVKQDGTDFKKKCGQSS